MDNLSSASTQPPVLSDYPAAPGAICPTVERPEPAAPEEVVFVAGFQDGIAADFAAFVSRGSPAAPVLVVGRRVRTRAADGIVALSLEECLRLTPNEWGPREPVASLVLFLPPRLRDPDRRALGELLGSMHRWPIRFVGIISTFRVHLDDPAALEAERDVLSLVRSSGLPSRVALFRPGYVLSPSSGVTTWLNYLAPLSPLAPRRLGTCFIEGAEFFAAIEAERIEERRAGGDPATSSRWAGRAVGRRQRAYTILGPNVSWRAMLSRHTGASRGQRAVAAAAWAFSWLPIGPLVAFVVALLARRFSWARPWSVHTLRPRSIRELLSLCHQGNIEWIKVVGYNNGVNHFGHRYPGRTIVSTVHCRRIAHAGPGRLKADCGATVRAARDYLGTLGEELYVIPNYSYVALGTAYFVPIHGSAVDHSTVADTICRVVFYDADRDRIVAAARHEAAFGENVYNLRSRVVVLRLYLHTRPRSRYFLRRETWNNPQASELLEAFRDASATNVEVRQSHAASSKVTVCKYGASPTGPSGPALELPRDALGRLWDRLEENPVSSFLMHRLTRHVAWHTELFFTPSEFELFWRTHAEVPLRKIQLRYIRRDGMPHSPFRDDDCVSADLFLFRQDKPAFDAYVKRTFTSVRTNPGKHSDQALECTSHHP
jgi:hypothetical protein